MEMEEVLHIHWQQFEQFLTIYLHNLIGIIVPLLTSLKLSQK